MKFETWMCWSWKSGNNKLIGGWNLKGNSRYHHIFIEIKNLISTEKRLNQLRYQNDRNKPEIMQIKRWIRHFYYIDNVGNTTQENLDLFTT